MPISSVKMVIKGGLVEPFTNWGQFFELESVRNFGEKLAWISVGIV